MSRCTGVALATAVVAATAIFAAPAALAKDGDVRVKGTCTSSATSKLRLSSENGRIEVEFEVDQNRNSVPWLVTLRKNGVLVASTTATTRAPSGSFTVRRVVGDTPSVRDRMIAVATAPSGATCTASASI